MKTILTAMCVTGLAVSLAACETTRADGSTKSPMSSTVGTKVSTNEAGEEIICKRDYATGSRVKYNEICGTAEEWVLIEEANQRKMRDMTESPAANSN